MRQARPLRWQSDVDKSSISFIIQNTNYNGQKLNLTMLSICELRFMQKNEFAGLSLKYGILLF